MIPPDGYRTIAIAPALVGIGRLSGPLAQLSLALIDAQTALIQRNVAKAIQRGRLDDRPTTNLLRGFAEALDRARVLLESLPDTVPTSRLAQKAEAWLAT